MRRAGEEQRTAGERLRLRSALKRRPSLIPTRRLLRWFWRFQLVRRVKRPPCVYCGSPARVYYGRAWFCRQHPLLVSGTAYGIRPKWSPLILTKRGVEDLFTVSPEQLAKSDFWRSTLQDGAEPSGEAKSSQPKNIS